MSKYSTKDPNYDVVDIPAVIKAKITLLAEAADEYAFAGSHAPESQGELRDQFFAARHDLEQTIKTCLER